MCHNASKLTWYLQSSKICHLLSFPLAVLLLSGSLCKAETPVTAWVQRFGDFVESDDWASHIVTDPDGNVIVAGYSDGDYTGQDVIIIKYSGIGLPLWTNSFNGQANADDQPVAIATDASGNIYVAVANFYPALPNFQEYATLAYSSTGVPLWTNSYKMANGNCSPTALALDASGNVFVTGSSRETNFGYDYATVKYSGTGLPLWTNQYAGPGGGNDGATAIAVDAKGNVFVTGYSTGNGGSSDYATIAYSSSGVPLWTNRYGGNDRDQPFGIGVSSNGNVFVTGYSYANGSEDYATIAYSTNGLAIWTNRYNGPANNYDRAKSLAVDSAGDVFVTGDSVGDGGHYDCTTIKYDGMSGFPLWINRHSGSAGNSITKGLVLDATGNVLVTAASVNNDTFYDYATVKYSGIGVALRTNYFRGPASATDYANALAVDAAGNAFVTGVSYPPNRDWVTVSCSSSGESRWTNYYGGLANCHDEATAVAVDGSGNVFVTGFSWVSNTTINTIKYSSDGWPLWTNKFLGDNWAVMAVDLSGNVFVAGHDDGFSSSFDYLTIAFSGEGVALWTNRYNGAGNGADRPSALVVDGKGNVFVTGGSYGMSGVEYATVAYSGEGVPLWTNHYAGTSVGGPTLAVDGIGNVILAATERGGGFATVAYSAAGTGIWTNRYETSGGPSAVCVGVDGRVFVTGTIITPGNLYDYATVAYTSTGTALWTNLYGFSGPLNKEDRATALAVDDLGNVIVTGWSPRDTYSWDDYDFATIKYSGDGVPVWTNRYGRGTATSVAVDPDGNVFVAGRSAAGYVVDYVTIKYSGSGVALWTNRYNGPANGNDKTQSRRSIAIGPDGAVFVTGTSDGDYAAGETPDFATIKYISLPEIAAQPIGRTNSVGATVKLAVGATGSAPLRYQWQRYGTNLTNADGISGANSNLLTFGSIQLSHAGDYTVVVSNAFGSTTSIAATLTVVAPFWIWLNSSGVSNGIFYATFTNLPGATFTVLGSTNVAWPLNAWSNLGPAVEMPVGSGLFQFTDTQTNHYPHRFYRVKSP